MRILVDTNRYRDFCADVLEVVDILGAADEVHMPFVTVAELRAGFLSGTFARRNESVLVRFLNRPRVGVLLPDEETTHHYAMVYSQLRRQGTPIPTNDLWIAALAVQHDLVLCSRDRHFDLLPQIARVG